MPAPTDPDDPRPLHRAPRFLALVALGGAIGTGAREALSSAFPPVSGIPVTIAAINVVGAFLLGLLLQVLTAGGDDTGTRRDVRIFAGTGILGGFTTYSALAADTVVLGDSGQLVAASGYAVGSLVLGIAAAALGLAAGARVTARRAAGPRR